jgi:hypothetical protein
VVGEALPSLQRRMRVVERREQLLCPIENAVSTIAGKNAELKEIIYNIKVCMIRSTHHITLRSYNAW